MDLFQAIELDILATMLFSTDERVDEGGRHDSELAGDLVFLGAHTMTSFSYFLEQPCTIIKRPVQLYKQSTYPQTPLTIIH